MTAPDTKRLVAYISDDLHEWLKDRSKQENRSLSNFVETLVRERRDEEGAAG